MPLPNLLIVGAQKSGTTWLHRSLDKSDRIFGSEKKELNFFNQRPFGDPEDLATYERNFSDVPGVVYWLESTPHYFRAAEGDAVDPAANIASTLDDPRIMVILRNPVDRYESAYIHHMMKERFPYADEVADVTDDMNMLNLGFYGRHLDHWLDVFPEMLVLLHDDAVADPVGLVDHVMRWLGLDNDIAADDLMFRTNDKRIKNRRLGHDWQHMPRLTPTARSQLVELYRQDVLHLQSVIGRDLSSWLAQP